MVRPLRCGWRSPRRRCPRSMQVLVPPVMLGGRIYRIVSPVDALLEVEEWVGAWWEPCSVPLTQVSIAPAATEAMLDALGVPSDERSASTERLAQPDLEALMRSRDPERPVGMRFDDEVVSRAAPLLKRQYPGNTRFRRHTPTSLDSIAEREPTKPAPNNSAASPSATGAPFDAAASPPSRRAARRHRPGDEAQ
jgi:hypothetical protein